MPELPDVEGYRRVAEQASGQRVRDVDVVDPSVVHDGSAAALSRGIVGRRFDDPHRHGKWPVLGFSGPSVLVHFGMTGLLEWREGSGHDGHRHDRLIVLAARGELLYRDQRKLRGVWFARTSDEAASVIGDLGPDALEVGGRDFEHVMGRRRGALKPVLTDQTAIAGLGNMMTDEILWRARVHPKCHWPDLPRQRQRGVHQTVRAVAARSARRGQLPLRRDWLSSQRDARDPACPRCGAALRRDRPGGRTSLWCPRCQPSP